MARVRGKPEHLNEETLGMNPLVCNLRIPITKGTQKVVNKYENADIKEYELEKQPYTKVYEFAGAKKQVNELPIRCKEMYLWFIHAIEPAKDYVWLDKRTYMEKMGIKSVNTFKEAVRILSHYSYIYPHASFDGVYWVNPQYIFKGNRINKYREYLLVENNLKAK